MKKEKIYPCLLLMNDLHVGKECVDEFKANFGEAIGICSERGIPDIVIGGDLFQSRSAQTLDVLLAVHDAFEMAAERDIDVTIMNGNHDKVDPEQDRGYCHIFSLANVCVVDQYLTLYPSVDANFCLHLIAYYPEEGSFRDKLNAVRENHVDNMKLNYLYVHEGISGSLVQAGGKELPAGVFGDFDKVLVGHYHNRCRIEGTEIYYIGSSRQHNFGEDENKGYTIINTDGSLEFIKNRANMRFATLHVPFERLGVHIKDEIDELKGLGYRVRVRVECTTEQCGSVNREMLFDAGAAKVEIESMGKSGKRIEQFDFIPFDKESVINTYVDFGNAKELSEAEIAQGIGYLNKI